MQDIRFTPRRLGHVNLWVSDLEASIRFYQEVCGVELVRRERAIKIAFHSNGNTHHDVGLVEISRGFDRVGRDGKVQIPASRGVAVGLNHLGWEMESEASLVEAWGRSADRRSLRTVDHLISHSVYVTDPDGNGHEFYADSLHEWRRIYNLDQEDEVTGEWDPRARDPDPTPFYNANPPLSVMQGAALHPGRLVGASFSTGNFHGMREFLERVAGLQAEVVESSGARRARFKGALGRADLELIEVPSGSPTGLQAFSFDLIAPTDLAALRRHCERLGVPAPVGREIDGQACTLLKDPDGFELRFVA